MVGILLPLWLVLVLVSVAICGAIGRTRQLFEIGILLGAVLGPLGIVIILCLDDRPKCPRCARRVDPAATTCVVCNAIFPAHNRRRIKHRQSALPPGWEDSITTADDTAVHERN